MQAADLPRERHWSALKTYGPFHGSSVGRWRVLCCRDGTALGPRWILSSRGVGLLARELLREMYGRWPFFSTLLSNMDMVLAKSDIHIASLYADLVPDNELRERIFGRIRQEIQSSIRHFLTITQQAALLDCNPWLARSFRNRVPYIDPLNHLQVEALRRYRSGPHR